MNCQDIQNAIDYIENHLTGNIDYEAVARQAYSSSFHFQRVFGITCGCTLGEYIRRRRLSLAGCELLNGRAKVIDVALRYGYETPESFSRAFCRFHGILPSQVKSGSKLHFFSRITLSLEDSIEGKPLQYTIKDLPQRILVGYKKRFSGVPYGKERAQQEADFAKTTRAKQWLLHGASCDLTTDYCIVTDIKDDGYDFYLAYELDDPTRAELFDSQVTGVDFMDSLGFETLIIPEATYGIFETEKKKRPIADYEDIRKRIVTEWLPSSGYVFTDAPEMVVMHWRPSGSWEKERYIEICLPIAKDSKM